MTIVEFFTLLGGLSMFLFGMRVMGDALEKRAGNQLKSILEKLTSSTFKGFLLGLGVTLIIQSSSATTVMVVGFVNSGLLTLHQATGVIMGANRHGCSPPRAFRAKAFCSSSSRNPLRRCLPLSASFCTCSKRTASGRTSV